MKTNELTGAALDWAVAKCEGVTVLPKMRGGCYVTLDRGETVLLRCFHVVLLNFVVPVA